MTISFEFRKFSTYLQSETWGRKGLYTLIYRCFGKHRCITAFLKILRIPVAIDKTKETTINIIND